jgi:hypothetical protein
MTIKIIKASLSGIFLHYEFEQKEPEVVNIIKAKSDMVVHEDLLMAFKNFIPHFVYITEQVTDENLIQLAIESPELYLTNREEAPDESLFNYRVSTIEHITKKGLNRIVIHGARCINNGYDEIYFKTPEIDLDDNKYKFVNALIEATDRWEVEVKAYMEGKQAPKSQLDMFEESDSIIVDATSAFNE